MKYYLANISKVKCTVEGSIPLTLSNIKHSEPYLVTQSNPSWALRVSHRRQALESNVLRPEFFLQAGVVILLLQTDLVL